MIDAHADGIVGARGNVTLVFQLGRVLALNRLLLHITPRAPTEEGLDDAIAYESIVPDAKIDSDWDFAPLNGSRATIAALFSPFVDF